MISPNFTPFPVLETDRLILREMNLDDSKAFFRLRTDDIVMEYLGREKCASLDAAIDFIKGLLADTKENKCIQWSITQKPNPELIGTICFWRIDTMHHRAEIGYSLLPEHHRKGIAPEAVKAVLAYGFNTMNLHSVEAHIDPYNLGSKKVLERNHFVQEGYYKESYFWQEKFTDTAVFSLIKPTYQKNLD